MKPCAKKYPVAHAGVFVVTYKNQIVTKKYSFALGKYSFAHGNIRLHTQAYSLSHRKIKYLPKNIRCPRATQSTKSPRPDNDALICNT